MKTKSLLLFLFLSVIAAAAQAADEITDTNTNSLTPTNICKCFTNPPLWDFSGPYQLTMDGDTITLNLINSATGQIFGTRTDTYTNETQNFSGSNSVTGRVFWTPKSTGFLIYPYREFLIGSNNGSPFHSSSTVHFKATLDSANLTNLTMNYEGKARLHIAQGGSITYNEESTNFSLPFLTNGVWKLDINPATQGNAFLGAATITVPSNFSPNGRAFSYIVVNKSRDLEGGVSMLHLIGYGETKGTSFVVTTHGTNVLSLTGSLLGQKVKFKSGS
jgi:hypothetical protein